MPALVEDQKFERYRINRWIGSGLSGETYEAEDTALLRKVAFKLIHPWGMLADAARRQFFREMQGISQLHHPYLASTLDYGEFGGKLYVVRRYATIGSLLSNEGRTWFKPPLPVPDAFNYTHQLAQTLDAIHAQGYLHGSLTLSNILILRGFNYEQEPDFAPFLISDMGLANFTRRFGQSQNTLLSITAAPEQLGKRVTPASDQFALAVLLYFWLAGRMPYFGSTEEIEQQKLTECIIPLASLNPNVTAQQEAILRKALAVYPDERFPSVLAFADALQATLLAPAAPLEIEESVVAALVEAQPAFEAIPQTEPDLARELSPTFAVEPDAGPEPVPAPDFVAIPDTEPPSSLDTPTEPSLEVVTISPVEEPAPPPVSLCPHLVITSAGDEQQQEFFLEPIDYTLGRAGSDTIFLDDSSVSRHHALLQYNDGRYILTDQRGAGGVSINGEKLADLATHTLVDGDHITIGKYDMLFRQN